MPRESLARQQSSVVVDAAEAESAGRARSSLPILEGRRAEVERTLYWRMIGEQPQWAVRAGGWTLVRDGSRAMRFDIESDISERESSTERRSDVARELKPLLEAWERDVDAEAGHASQY